MPKQLGNDTDRYACSLSEETRFAERRFIHALEMTYPCKMRALPPSCSSNSDLSLP